jgi:acetyltransferase
MRFCVTIGPPLPSVQAEPLHHLRDFGLIMSTVETPALEKRNTPDILFTFNSIVIVGASDEETRIGGVPIVLLKKYGFEGKIYGLNPKYQRVQGVPCFAEPEELPEPVDLAIFILSGERLKDMLPRLKRKGLKGVVVYSAGFAESGAEGKELQAWLSTYARENEIAVVGPNCVGQISFAHNRSLTFANPMMVFPRMEPGRVALLSQSGGVAGNIWADAVLRGTRFSHVLTTGNEADLSYADFLTYLADDPHTDVVLGYIEGLKSGPEFCAAARRMQEKNKPLVLLRVGRSAMGQDTISSHTGQMSSDDSGYQAAFDRYGVIRAKSLNDLNDYARVLSLKDLKPKVTVVTTTGGIAVYAADLCADYGVEMSNLSKETEAKLAKFVPSFGRIRNPVDLTAQVVNNAKILEDALRALLEDPETGILLFLLSGKGTKEQSEQAIAMFKKLQAETSKKIVLSWTSVPAEVRMRAAAAGLIVYEDPVNFLRPLQAYFRFAANVRGKPAATARVVSSAAKPVDTLSVRSMLTAGSDGRSLLSESRAMEVLERAGVACPKRWSVRSEADLARIASDVVFPCVMKISEPVIAHKSDVGGVKVGIASQEELVQSWRFMAKNLAATEVMVIEQIGRGVEVLVGCLRDTTFGMRLAVGAGGIWTNLLEDTVTLIPPFDADYIRASLQKLKIWGALSGGRGQAPAAIDALVDTIAGTAAVGWSLRDVLSEFECNPIIVTADRAVVVDAIGFA